ncbi:MAG: hypothetical protein KIT48_15770, partial [Pseudolabrys sp.]|nr:hypothetical protein [Pseudolabrys sp.]
ARPRRRRPRLLELVMTTRAPDRYPEPPPPWNADGSHETGRLRVRPSWFGFAVVEELVEYRDGRQRWERIRWPQELERPR